ncbi:S1 family peptidase [Streptomyces sp. SID8352]|uniref:S1 family peptidase n=1 Tax=Streptomyces sp. SID8352 TaxID=2690338 RepID=UPI0013709ABA|nr:S1 family peptidase [Streptomyces sp. SID8352]MYU24731.1 streptogrisin B precursor [Streptomyces sp. SID8352]
MIPSCSPSVRRTVLRAVVVLAMLLGWYAADGGSARAAQGAGDRAGQRAAVTVRGGDVLYSPGARCTLGFNARSGSATYALVTGQCAARGGPTWYADPALTVSVGVTAGVRFPGNDYASVRYTNTSAAYPGEVSLGGGAGILDITGAGSPVVGQSVCHAGRVSGYRCGTVQAVNVSISYGGGTVTGLFRSNACADAGDIGGPAFSGATALGVIVAAGGNCAVGGSTYYQPVTPWLAAYGLSIY